MRTSYLKGFLARHSTTHMVLFSIQKDGFLHNGMGVDIPSIRVVIQVEPPSSIQVYFLETERVSRGCLPSKAILYYNNRHIARNRYIGSDMTRFCKIENL